MARSLGPLQRPPGPGLGCEGEKPCPAHPPGCEKAATSRRCWSLAGGRKWRFFLAAAYVEQMHTRKLANLLPALGMAGKHLFGRMIVDDWSLVPRAFEIARRTMRVVRGNLVFTAAYNLLSG